MKRYWKKSTTLFLALAMLVAVFAMPTSAANERSSLYLSRYRAWLTPVSDGQINVNVDVQAVDYMDEVGALKIEIYESADGGETWTRPRIYHSALEDNMLVQDDVWYYDTAVVHQGTVGYKYFAIVTIYAGDSTGYDTRDYQTTTVTARR